MGRVRMHDQGANYMEIDRLPEDVTFREYRETVEELSTPADSFLPLLSERVSYDRGAYPSTSDRVLALGKVNVE